MSKDKLDFTGCESMTSSPAYDVLDGYYLDEITCPETKEKVSEAVSTLRKLISYLNDQDLVC